jgi:hypothetical protein
MTQVNKVTGWGPASSQNCGIHRNLILADQSCHVNKQGRVLSRDRSFMRLGYWV